MALKYLDNEEYLTLYIVGLVALTVLIIHSLYVKSSKKLPKLPAIEEQKEYVVKEIKETVREMREFMSPRKSQRFRKRDRMWFYGRKMMRRVEDNIKTLENAKVRHQAEGGKFIKKMAKRFIGDGSESGSANGDPQEGRPAEDYLEEEEERLKTWFPAELKYILNSFHMFGDCEMSLFAEIYPAIETIRVPAGQFLFRIGEPDVHIFVVQNGRLDVTTTDEQGVNELKKVGPGESLTSLLSFIDMLTGHKRSYKTVQARAGVDSVVLRLSVETFMGVFQRSPDLLIRVVQMIMARLQRVFFVALHQHLGLANELVRKKEDVEVGEEPMSLQMELALVEEGDKENTAEAFLEAGVLGLQRELDLEDDRLLRETVEVRWLEKGDTLMTESSYSDAALVYVIQGELTMRCGEERDILYTAGKGECVGQLALLTGEANFYTCAAKCSSVVALLPKQSFFSIVSTSPEMVLSLAQSTIQRLSPLVRRIDFALDWVTIEGGRKVVPPVNQADTAYLILSGRLRGYKYNGEARELVGEYGRGDIVGIVDVITGVKRSTSYLAVRDTEICMMPPQLLDYLKKRCPSVMSKLVTVLGRRLHSANSGDRGSLQSTQSHRYNSIAVYPNHPDIPMTAFCLELERSLSSIGSCARLSSTSVLNRFGPDALQPRNEYRINSWLNQQEDRHDCIIYQCDINATVWTRKCFRHADLILILAEGAAENTISQAEKDIEDITKRIRKEFVLLWDPETPFPTNTRDFLKRRPWLSSHFHLKVEPWMKKKFKDKSEERILITFSKVCPGEPNINSDFSRLARHIQGASIGLVLGGGGARGAAHLGMLRSIMEAGIPVDKVGGVSIGAFMTALWSMHRDFGHVTTKASQWFYNMTRYVGLLDLTYPATSLFTGGYFNWTLTQTFPDEAQIEDLWLPFYCVSTDVTVSRQRVHTTGSVWRYCRASMSYAWICPPMCDPKDGHLLLDGCYVNNVPGDVMLQLNCSHILVVDVTAMDSTDLTNYGDSLSGWWLLWKRFNPFTAIVNIPNQAQIQERLAYCSHYKNLEELKQNDKYEYIMPPVGHFSSANFQLFQEIYDVGYHHGSTFFAGLRKAGTDQDTSRRAGTWLPTADRVRQRSRVVDRRDSGNYTFTDLSTLVNAATTWRNKTKTKL